MYEYDLVANLNRYAKMKKEKALKPLLNIYHMDDAYFSAMSSFYTLKNMGYSIFYHADTNTYSISKYRV